MFLTNSNWLAPLGMLLILLLFLIFSLIRIIALIVLVIYEGWSNMFYSDQKKYSHLSRSRYRKNKFKNPWDSCEKTGSFLRPILILWDCHKLKNSPSLSVRKIDYPNLIDYFYKDDLQQNIQYTWIGHASALIQCDGFNILTDPIFSDRCSPVQWFGPKRFTPAPEGIWDPNNLPPIDVVLISHDHHDHLDYDSVRYLVENNKVRYWCVPLGIAEWLIRYFPTLKEKIIERDWYQTSKEIVSNIYSSYPNYIKNEIELICTPAQHFSGRTLFDFASRLWCSWIIKTNHHKIYFAGDTGYRSVPRSVNHDELYSRFEENSNNDINDLTVCPIFKEIGENYGGFDLCLLPIGAYSPRWFNSYMHFNPYDACCAHKELKSKKSVGIHWGTFTLSDENVNEPALLLRKMRKATNIGDDEFITVDCGQTIIV